jgi:hypothetical protein
MNTAFRKYRSLVILLVLLASAPAARAQDDGRIIFSDPKSKDGEVISDEDLLPKTHSLAANLMIGTGGFGIGALYRYSFNDVFSWFADFTFTEAQDDRQREAYDPYLGQIPLNKVNYVFRIPLFVGGEYRLFADEIVENFRPQIGGGVGPVLLYISPADGDFFASLDRGSTRLTFGGFLAAGADFGFDRSNVLGVRARYFLIPVPPGVVSVNAGPMDNANGFYVGLMFGKAF